MLLHVACQLCHAAAAVTRGWFLCRLSAAGKKLGTFELMVAESFFPNCRHSVPFAHCLMLEIVQSLAGRLNPITVIACCESSAALASQ